MPVSDNSFCIPLKWQKLNILSPKYKIFALVKKSLNRYIAKMKIIHQNRITISNFTYVRNSVIGEMTYNYIDFWQKKLKSI